MHDHDRREVAGGKAARHRIAGGEPARGKAAIGGAVGKDTERFIDRVRASVDGH